MSEWKLGDSIEVIRSSRVIKGCISSVAVYFFFRYLFSLIAPFALAFLLITLCYPLLGRIQSKIPVKKKFLAVGIIVPLLLFVIGALWLAMVWCAGRLDDLPGFCTRVGEQMESLFHQSCCRLDGRFGWDGQEIEHYVIEQMTVIMENVQIQVVPQLLSSSYSCFKGIFSAIGFLAITCIAAFLLEKDYTAAVEWLKSSGELRFIWAVIQGVLSYIITFLKAQGVILCVISLSCGAVLYFAGIENGILLGVLAGVLDMLPFIGTGMVLVPLSVWQLLNGRYVQTTVCIILYGACILARELLEPRLIGKRMGIAPVMMLFAVYAGVKLFGVSGILKGPLALIVIYEIMKNGFDGKEQPVYDKGE
ncbi:MAG: AI-2E family transporter [Clostridiales bacterium]|nr:AI-2E family transporter [Clostridiales bacterium]